MCQPTKNGEAVQLRNMNKIIITGSEGFVGKPTTKALEEKGYKVLRFDIKRGLDIRDYKQLKKTIQPGDKVLHLAAIARFSDADKDPLLTYETNIKGTENVAKACIWNNAERLVYSSTGSVYMPIEKEPPIKEDFQIRGNSVYGCSKAMGEFIIKNWKPNYIILRYAHLYGEGKIGHGAIGGFIDRMNRGLAPKLYGGLQSNDFTYIKDIVQANLLALEVINPKAMNQAYNIGTSEELSTKQVFEIMRKVFGYQKEFKYLPQRTVDPLRFVYDISKAKKLLDYQPRYNFKKGIKDYYETFFSKEK